MNKLATFFAVCVCAAAPILTAQQPAGNQAQPAKFYEELIRTPIVPPRSAADIQADLASSGKELQQADKSIAGAQARIKEAEGWLTAEKKEAEELKSKLDLAKKEKRDPDKLALEGQLKQLDLVEEYLKKTKSVRDAELDLANAQKELVNSRKLAYQAEADLRQKSDRIKNAGPQSPDLSKAVLDAAQAGENTLKLMKSVSDKNQDVAGRMTRLADRRIDLVQSRNKLLSEDRIRGAAASMQKK